MRTRGQDFSRVKIALQIADDTSMDAIKVRELRWFKRLKA